MSSFPKITTERIPHEGVYLRIEGDEVDDPDVDDEGQGNILRIKVTHEGLIYDLIDRDGNVSRTMCSFYQDIIGDMHVQ